MKEWPPQYNRSYLPSLDSKFWFEDLETMDPEEREQKVLLLVPIYVLLVRIWRESKGHQELQANRLLSGSVKEIWSALPKLMLGQCGVLVCVRRISSSSAPFLASTGAVGGHWGGLNVLVLLPFLLVQGFQD